MAVYDQYSDYLAAATTFQRLVAPTGATGVTVYATFNDSARPMLPMEDSGPISCDSPYLLKYFDHIRFSGKGKIYIRALVDEIEVARGYVTLSEGPTDENIFKLPDGTAGYSIRLQMVGIAIRRYYDIMWEAVSGEAS